MSSGADEIELKMFILQKQTNLWVRSFSKLVYVSTSNNIYKNLALEDWFYQHLDLSETSLLFLWSNRPCVVIGRHQNPWTEVNLKHLNQHLIQLARRNSGGGTVYHDTGNLNCTFFTKRSKYHRRSNLEFLCQVLQDRWNVRAEINKREDIVVGDCKVSGTAAKLGHSNAYHHCTILVDVNNENLSQSLTPAKLGIESKATASVKSKIKNLRVDCPGMTVKDLANEIGHQYLNDSTLIKYVNPSSQDFNGLDQIIASFQSWEWIYGKTPSFRVALEGLHLNIERGRIVESSVLDERLLNMRLDRDMFNYLVGKVPLINENDLSALCSTDM